MVAELVTVEIINPIIILALNYILYIADVTSTIYHVNEYRKLEPKKDYTKLEGNQIIVFLWKKFGFKKGSVFAVIMTFTLLSFVQIFAYHQSPEIIFILLGVYLLMMHYHYRMFQDIRRLKHAKRK